MKIGVFSAGRNCNDLARGAVQSVIDQGFKDWLMVVVDDDSDEDIGAHIPQDSRVFTRMNMTRKHCCASKQSACAILSSMLAPEDILVQLDLDDELLPGALQRIHDAHADGAWVTYGTWVDGLTREANIVPDYSAEIHESIRHRPWLLTAPNTVRVGLWRLIPEEFFQWEASDKMYETGHDGSLMFAAVDLAGPDRVKKIEEPLYMYRRNLETNVLRAWPNSLREAVFTEQRKKPRLEQREEL